MAILQPEQRRFKSWGKLLAGFGTVNELADSDSGFVTDVEMLLQEFESEQEQWRIEQKTRADNFNVLGTMRLTRNELFNSDILAWLLNPDGTHGQGKLGFRLFLQLLNLPNNFVTLRYRVLREHRGEESQIDIVVEAEHGFIIGIETKIDAMEGYLQTDREWRDLQRRKQQLGIRDDPYAFFLTTQAAQPGCKSFRALTWQTVANIFEAFSDEAEAEMVKLFARHYAECIHHEIVAETEETE